MSEEPIQFSDTMYSVEANVLVTRAAISLLVAGLPVNASSVHNYMHRYFSQKVVAKILH